MPVAEGVADEEAVANWVMTTIDPSAFVLVARLVTGAVVEVEVVVVEGVLDVVGVVEVDDVVLVEVGVVLVVGGSDVAACVVWVVVSSGSGNVIALRTLCRSSARASRAASPPWGGAWSAAAAADKGKKTRQRPLRAEGCMAGNQKKKED